LTYPRIGPVALLTLVALLVCVNTSEGVRQSSPQQTEKPPEASASQQPPTVEGKWLLTYDYRGAHRTRTFTLERDKKGRLIGTQNEPVCPCDVVASFKGDKLTLKLTPHRPTHVENLAPGVVLGDPLSTILEAKVSGDTMEGKFYLERGSGEPIKFKGIRQARTEPPGSPPKN
jgi:hypothetical protein